MHHTSETVLKTVTRMIHRTCPIHRDIKRQECQEWNRRRIVLDVYYWYDWWYEYCHEDIITHDHVHDVCNRATRAARKQMHTGYIIQIGIRISSKPPWRLLWQCYTEQNATLEQGQLTMLIWWQIQLVTLLDSTPQDLRDNLQIPLEWTYWRQTIDRKEDSWIRSRN